jgi:hypothetical protein
MGRLPTSEAKPLTSEYSPVHTASTGFIAKNSNAKTAAPAAAPSASVRAQVAGRAKPSDRQLTPRSRSESHAIANRKGVFETGTQSSQTKITAKAASSTAKSGA